MRVCGMGESQIFHGGNPSGQALLPNKATLCISKNFLWSSQPYHHQRSPRYGGPRCGSFAEQTCRLCSRKTSQTSQPSVQDDGCRPLFLKIPITKLTMTRPPQFPATAPVAQLDDLPHNYQLLDGSAGVRPAGEKTCAEEMGEASLAHCAGAA